MAKIAHIFKGGIPGALNIHYADGTARINVRAGIGWDVYQAEAEQAIASRMQVYPQSEYRVIFPPPDDDGDEVIHR